MSAPQMDVQPAPEPVPFRTAAVSRRDVLITSRVLGLVALLGLPLGVLWSVLAPPEFVARSTRAPVPGGVLPFVGQSEHRFDDMATFMLIGLAAGVLTGAALWVVRRGRGPLALLAAVLGSLISAWLAMRVGLWVAAAWYPNLASTGAPFRLPPVLDSAWVIIAQPFGFAVSYSILVAWNDSPDAWGDRESVADQF